MHGLVDAHGVQRVGVVVDVGDGLAAELDDHVAAAQAGQVCGAAAAHAGERYAASFRGVVRDGADVGAQAVAPALAAGGLLHGHVVRSRIAVRQIAHHRGGELGDALHTLVVQRVRVVARAVVVRVAAGEEVEHRHVFRIEGGAVGGQVGIVLQDEIEASGNVAALQ